MAKPKKNESTARSPRIVKKSLLIETAWEVCNQVGGIYTVIRSKVPAMVEKWGENYCLLGPYFPSTAMIEFEPIMEEEDNPFCKATIEMRELGYAVHYGRWLITGKPKIILFDFKPELEHVNELKFQHWQRHKLSTLYAEPLVDNVLAFGEMMRIFLEIYVKLNAETVHTTVHFHEWMAASALLDLPKNALSTVFTTHATMLGRYIAGNVPDFYKHLHTFDWETEAKHYGIEAQAHLERLAAQKCHVLSTVSDVTARECEVFFGRKVDLVLPNGLNVTRFAALHEFQNLHLKYKEKINQFVMGHFFQSYSFDLDNTLYFFTSGRYEFRNKGYDLTLEALRRLNEKMIQAGIETTVVMFLITKRPVHSIDPEVLQSRAVMEEIRQTCESMERQIGEQLFYASASNEDPNLPNLNNFVDEYWRLRLRRTIQTWKTKKLPHTLTHLLQENDEVTHYLQESNLMNHQQDRVKVVYHPDFIAPSNPLFGMEYNQFVRGCHLGIFPSYYEPWGYTPLECVVRGIPTVTSDLSGFGDFMNQLMQDPESVGVYVLNRSDNGFGQAAEDLADLLLKFVQMNRRERITQRNKVENIAEIFDWSSLRSYYDTAHALAKRRKR